MLRARPAPAGSRRGITLIEIAIVVAIIGVVAALGSAALTKTMPSWRTRRAARELAAAFTNCRQMAINENARCRVRLASGDANPDDGGDGIGVYYVEREATGGTWDVLPVDLDGTDDQTGEGTVELSEGGQDELPGVSLQQWGTIAGVSGDDIVYNARGWLENPDTDFNTDGYIEVTFVNKAARREGFTDDWTVAVSRGGLVRLESSRDAATPNPSGTEEASTAAGLGSGYSP